MDTFKLLLSEMGLSYQSNYLGLTDNKTDFKF